jgi:hypothetical protein
MIKLMGVEPIFTWTEPGTLVTGEKISNMVSVSRHGLMVPDMRAIMSTERNMVLGHLNGRMVQCILVNSITITFMEKEFTLGLMAVNMKENGVTIRCTAEVPSNGLMVENTSVNTLTTKSKAMESLSGQMVVHIKVTGSMVNSTEKESI